MDFSAELYCLLHRGAPGDVAYYAKFCDQAKRVLELGCGEGRISCHLAGLGLRVVGVDIHPGMIERAQRTMMAKEQDAPEFLVADICNLDVQGTFDRVVMPFTTIFCLDADEKRECLRKALAHLEPGGRFSLDTYHAGIFSDPAWCDDHDFVPLTSVSMDETEIAIFERTINLPTEQIAEVTYGHQVLRGPRMGQWIEYTIRHHYCLGSHLSQLLTDVGFEEVELYGGFGGEPLFDDSDRVVLTGRAPVTTVPKRTQNWS